MKFHVESVLGYLDLKGDKKRANDVFRAMACFIDYVYFFDESTTVNGSVAILDFTRYSLKFETYFPLEDRRDFTQTWQV